MVKKYWARHVHFLNCQVKCKIKTFILNAGISRVMDFAAKMPPVLPEIKMSYKHRVENKVY